MIPWFLTLIPSTNNYYSINSFLNIHLDKIERNGNVMYWSGYVEFRIAPKLLHRCPFTVLARMYLKIGKYSHGRHSLPCRENCYKYVICMINSLKSSCHPRLTINRNSINQPVVHRGKIL